METNKLEPKKVRRKYFDQERQKVLFEYIFFEDIPNEYKDEFGKWIRGQTCPVVEGGRLAVYWYDWIRWYQYKTGKRNFLLWD